MSSWDQFDAKVCGLSFQLDSGTWPVSAWCCSAEDTGSIGPVFLFAHQGPLPFNLYCLCEAAS